jgi:predicted DCC family thiol-disulfide oxidoreductase YuxK
MKRLYVLYDADCALCLRCRVWLAQQPAYVELRFIPQQSPEVTCRFPGIERLGLGEELLVVSDEGGVYRGGTAWIMCLYALREYREWSMRLAHPALLPLARRICELISENRLRLSSFLKESPEALRHRLATEDAGPCDGQACKQSLRA